jgi:hypothetical protein
MEWVVELDERERFIRATQWDQFSLEEQARFLSDIFTSSYWKPGLGVLIDYRGLKVDNLTGGDLTAITVILQSIRKRIESSRIALLCDSDRLFSLGREFGMLLAPKLENNVVVFKDEDAAIAWLAAGARD